MDILFLFVIIFLFLLAIFDLSVGVSNDAVNFLTSAVGSRAASFKRVIIVASIGVFIGAAMSNGMMDIARHGIFRPEHFSFNEIICIFMAVMVTDIILLDIFNSLGMPTSTTVSLVFELLGATFVVSLLKMTDGTVDLSLTDLINTEKALSVILGIFLSVAIAFVFGTIVQFLSRSIFSFGYKQGLTWKIGIFGGICTTAIIYFLLIKGTKDLTFMTPEVKTWIADHTSTLVAAILVVSAILMQLLHFLKVNVLKIIVLLGTFALAMAFAGNDLVNFIGVPLTGLASFQDFTASGATSADTFMMDSLNAPASTKIYFLIGAGVMMVVSLATSKKARKVTETSIGLGSQNGGDEMFGSSRIGRGLVRLTLSVISSVKRATPPAVRRWFARRFDTDSAQMEDGAAFELVRGSVNLVLAAALIAIGTSMKMPLSTTFVTFMVAMGTSLADKAWSRESAVFRVTGVISVIGGWFVTAGAAFIGAGLIVVVMHYGGKAAMIAMALLTIAILIRSNRRFRQKKTEESGDTLFQSILTTDDSSEKWNLLKLYISAQQRRFLEFTRERFVSTTDAFVAEDNRRLAKDDNQLAIAKKGLKSARRKETLCFRSINADIAIEKSAWFHLSNNSLMAMLYNLRRVNEVFKEHVGNNFLPLPARLRPGYELICHSTVELISKTITHLDKPESDSATILRRDCDKLKDQITDACDKLYDDLHRQPAESMTVVYVYLNMLQETREIVSNLRRYIRAIMMLNENAIGSKRVVNAR